MSNPNMIRKHQQVLQVGRAWRASWQQPTNSVIVQLVHSYLITESLSSELLNIALLMTDMSVCNHETIMMVCAPPIVYGVEHYTTLVLKGDATDCPGQDGSSVSCERLCIHPHPPKIPKPGASSTSLSLRTRADSGQPQRQGNEETGLQNEVPPSHGDNTNANQEQVSIFYIDTAKLIGIKANLSLQGMAVGSKTKINETTQLLD